MSISLFIRPLSEADVGPDEDKRIRDAFTTMVSAVGGAAYRHWNLVIVHGPPGLGKSYDIERALELIKTKWSSDFGGEFKYTIIKGRVTPPQLFKILYQHNGQVIVFDDSDSILRDETALNTLKGALELGDRPRAITWASSAPIELDHSPKADEVGRYITGARARLKEIEAALKKANRVLARARAKPEERRAAEAATAEHEATRARLTNHIANLEGQRVEALAVPRTFHFTGQVIIVTNIDLEEEARSGKKLAEHYGALLSRAEYIDLGIKTREQYMVRIYQLADPGRVIRDRWMKRGAPATGRSGGMLDTQGLTPKEQVELVSFLDQHYNDFRELSIRTVVKIANHIKLSRQQAARGGDPESWKTRVMVTNKDDEGIS